LSHQVLASERVTFFERHLLVIDIEKCMLCRKEIAMTCYRDFANSHVLLLEDDYMQAANVAIALEQQDAEVVGPLPFLQDGLHALANEKIDAAILDVRLLDGESTRLPTYSGRGLCRSYL
jgi:ActR/RegA family two-component response regulator